MSYSHFVAQLGVRVQDREDARGGYNLVEQLTRKSILDLIEFPEGKMHFEKMKEKWIDLWSNKGRVLETMVIQERIRRRAGGQASGQ